MNITIFIQYGDTDLTARSDNSFTLVQVSQYFLTVFVSDVVEGRMSNDPLYIG